MDQWSPRESPTYILLSLMRHFENLLYAQWKPWSPLTFLSLLRTFCHARFWFSHHTLQKSYYYANYKCYCLFPIQYPRNNHMNSHLKFVIVNYTWIVNLNNSIYPCGFIFLFNHINVYHNKIGRFQMVVYLHYWVRDLLPILTMSGFKSELSNFSHLFSKSLTS